MRARWALLIAGGVLVLVVAVLFLPAWSEPVRVQVLGETNGYRAVLVTNIAKRVYYVMTWSEYRTNKLWSPDHSTIPQAQTSLERGEGFAAQVLMPTRGQSVSWFFTSLWK